ncbi:MAG: response regulator transcription factor [Dehalococcoidia bacterium]
MRVLSVDDDPQTLRYLRRCLDREGYQAIVTSDPSQVTGLVEMEQPDLVLLDLMLPGSSGFDLFEQIKEFSNVPVIFLTAVDRDEDAVHALTMGTCDYITKPFSPSELLARIAAALRRHSLRDESEVSQRFALDDLTIDFAARLVTVGGETIALSATEYRLLYELATHAGRVLTHDQILEKVWGAEYVGGIDVLRSFIRNLRRKLGDQAQHPHYIFTEPRVGYRMPRAESLPQLDR